ncbi:uncharacterized protein Z520_04184 [Fonsecaea multimorphosa CBS 102226]|uniref:Tyrosine specific protein phosphatases domain-containing protein n=1 Tax=Fonsecaea multimorphosa CBS 102226 TaxID=1442371 RepID=A0A0D2KUU4_9EURO|nr:uncharacterized protein Z520_04184 [Fonsecaea multimorphosa CBS 102226]KIY00499.1 hypothetical protein Z520_04184 [Fonsecaea multimorphosa CBS 102226]OAL27014.1 hypothetical protein AYO22_03958 [Fonsecaea multimorphosa]
MFSKIEDKPDASWPPPPGVYAAAQDYSDKRQLEAPKVFVPPPDLEYHNGKPSFRVRVSPFTYSATHYGNPDFLAALVNSHKLDLTHSMLIWQYEMRRSAQHILPFLLLGPSSSAKDPVFLKQTGITLLVAVRSTRSLLTRPTFLDPASFPSSAGRATLTLDFDHPREFIPLVKSTVRAINDHLESSCVSTPVQDIDDVRGKVLVFCESGNERSPLLVAAYLMIVYGVDATVAIHIIQSQRFCIGLSDEMKNVLLDLQAITRAERQVSNSDAGASSHGDNDVPPTRKLGKRSLDEFYDADENMECDSEHIYGARAREGVAPFVDVFE